jgi:hypothetical protein
MRALAPRRGDPRAGQPPVSTTRRGAHRWLGALILLLGAAGADARPATWTPGQPGESLEVSLVTVGPGEVYWQRFGHNALRVRDAASGAEALYNYGIFDFAEENFFLRFLRGEMTYELAARRPADDLGQYRAEGRQVIEQALNLSPTQRLELARYLAWNTRPENRKYRYDYFLANCSTKVRDALDAALGGALRASTDGRSRGYTLRMHALRLTSPDLPVYLGVHAGLGPTTDQPVDFWDEMFVPMEVARHVRDVRVRDDADAEVPLVAAEAVLLKGRVPEPAAPPGWIWRFLALGLALAAVLRWLARGNGARRRGFGALAGVLWLLCGIGGLLLLFLWFGTAHHATWRNANLALFNPLCLALLPAAWRALRGRAPASRAATWIAAAVASTAFLAWLWLVLPGHRQDTLDWIALWLPVHFAAWRALRRPAG